MMLVFVIGIWQGAIPFAALRMAYAAGGLLAELSLCQRTVIVRRVVA